MKKELTDKELLTSYQQELQTLGYAKNTVIVKIRTLINFKEFTRKPYKQTTVTDLQNFNTYLKNKGLHSNTIRSKYHSITQFFMYLEREECVIKNPCNYYNLNIKKQPKKARAIVTQQEIKKLYSIATSYNQRMLLHLCYSCGLRAKEFEQLNIEDVLISQQLIRIVKGKNNTYRVVPIPKGIFLEVLAYLNYRKTLKVNTKALLLNAKENRLKAYTARFILHQLIKKAQITKQITLHSLRHSIATHLLENNVQTKQVQFFLGHKQLTTTEIYVRVSKQQLKQLK